MRDWRFWGLGRRDEWAHAATNLDAQIKLFLWVEQIRARDNFFTAESCQHCAMLLYFENHAGLSRCKLPFWEK
jgi:hypothetical protein